MLQIRKTNTFSKEYEYYINKLTMSPKSMNMNNGQRPNDQWTQKMKNHETSFVSRLVFCLKFFMLLLYLLLFFTYFVCVFSLRESFIFKCQTYLPVKYLIYSSVYFNFDLVRAFHFNLISHSLHSLWNIPLVRSFAFSI